VRAEPNASGGLFMYKLALIKDEAGNIVAQVSPQTQTDRTAVFEQVVLPPADGWFNVIIITLDDKIAFFLDGKLLVAIRDVPLLGGTLAIGAEPNTIAHFDDLLIRDTSVGE
jgi:hypothetical protein